MTAYEQFQEHWEQEADKARKQYDACSVSELLAEICAKRYGRHFQIWYSLGARASLSEAGLILFRVLESQADYLVRNHCAAALISIAGAYADGYRPKQLSACQTQRVSENLKSFREKFHI